MGGFMLRFEFMMVLIFATSLAVAGSDSQGRHDHAAHVHGTAKLAVAVEGARLAIHLESPLDGLVGFEHAPNSAKERATATAALKTLRAGERLFVPTASAGCRLSGAHIEAPVLEGQKSDGHSDLDADYHFDCARPDLLKGVAVNLFKTFPGIARIDAVVLTGKGQQAYKLNARMRFMAW